MLTFDCPDLNTRYEVEEKAGRVFTISGNGISLRIRTEPGKVILTSTRKDFLPVPVGLPGKSIEISEVNE